MAGAIVMPGRRWTAEELATALARSGRRAVVCGASQSGVSIGNTHKLSERSIKGVTEYLTQLRLAGLPDPVLEYEFHPTRKWRSDFAWPDQKVLAEYEGGIFTGGRHTRGKGFQEDCIKYNEISLMGFVLLRFTYDIVKSGVALATTSRALE